MSHQLKAVTIDTIKANIKSCFSRWHDFRGRSSRSEFWSFYIFSIIVAMFMNLFSPDDIGVNRHFIYNINFSLSYITIAFVVFIFIPLTAVAVRRLRDAGFMPWWLLLFFVPFIGNLWLMILWLYPSKNYIDI